MHEWCQRAFQVAWPTSLEMLEELMEERAAEVTAGPTSLDPLLASVRFVEAIARIAPEDCLASLEAVKKYKNSLAKELAVKKPKTEKIKAPPMLLMALASLEALVLRDGPPMLRAMGWLRLVQHWSGLRSDDAANIGPETLAIEPDGSLECVAVVTKTTGPGKKLPARLVTVAAEAYFHDPRWLPTGVQLWADLGGNWFRSTTDACADCYILSVRWW